MPDNKRRAYQGPAFLSHGFRPFFLIAGVYGAIVIPYWVLAFAGEVPISSLFAPVDWHIHEMLFGYTGAVICGFLFTAVPNWTGRMPVRGWPLAALLVLWGVGRLAMTLELGLGPIAVMRIDCAFLTVLSIVIASEIIAGRNWRNLAVLVPLIMLLASNLLFHLETQAGGESDVSRRLGLSVILFLVMLIGGRIIPSFTRNWLNKFNPGALPTPFGRFDGFCLAAGAVALGVWVAAPEHPAGAVLLGVAGLIHALRLSRWRGERAFRSPLLLMLHVAYGFIPLGFLALSGGATAMIPELADAGVHLLGVGAIGGMTVAVMMRASLGHTGRPLESRAVLTVAFSLILLSAAVRSISSYSEFFGVSGLALAGAFWSAGFTIFVAVVGPWLISPNHARRKPN